MKLVIMGDPRTKKNSQTVVHNGTRMYVRPSKAYEEYRRAAFLQIPGSMRQQISQRINLKCVYFMQTRRRVDLVNLLEATCDILVDAGVLEDDNSRIVAGHDGSRVDYDKECPRVEIEIEETEEHGEPSPV